MNTLHCKGVFLASEVVELVRGGRMTEVVPLFLLNYLNQPMVVDWVSLDPVLWVECGLVFVRSFPYFSRFNTQILLC